MAAIFTAANKDTTPATHAGAGDTQIIVSGTFGLGASLTVEAGADSLTKAAIASFNKPGGKVISAKTGTTLTFTVHGGNTSNTSIDVSAL